MNGTPGLIAFVTAEALEMCTLDILMHLPRSVFSERQPELFLWLLTINEVNDVPSVYQMKTINQKLQQ
ncbi:hypothetical protein PM082_023356 [Marasmius tenuissimus]|nr:hypothetical protein PM082_023356 [Marasmius tenuissimus]